MTKEFTRRDFMVSGGKLLAGGVIASIATFAVPKSALVARGAEKAEGWEEQWQKATWGFVVDTNKCIGCGRCVKACKQENGVPMDKEVYRTWVERYVEQPGGQLYVESPEGGQNFSKLDMETNKSFFVPKLCNQCDNPPCTKVCPVGATYKTGDGIVLVDRERCVGCRYCIQACPYGARFLHPDLKVADKCTWCYHRITKGLLPACVQVCPTGARVFGNLQDPNNPVTPILEKERIEVLKPSMGTKPKVNYLGLDRVVV